MNSRKRCHKGEHNCKSQKTAEEHNRVTCCHKASLNDSHLLPAHEHGYEKCCHSTILVHTSMYLAFVFATECTCTTAKCTLEEYSGGLVEYVNDYVKLVYFNQEPITEIHAYTQAQVQTETCMTKCPILRQSANTGQ